MIEYKNTKLKVNNKEVTIGSVLLSSGSTTESKTGGWRSKKPVVDREKCSGCGICWIYCPEGAVKKNAEGKLEINLDYCKGCGICFNECPKKAVKMVKEEK